MFLDSERRMNVIDRRYFIKKTGMAAAFVSLPGVLSRCSDKKELPNILFIMSDNHAAQALSAYKGFFSEIAKLPT
jgi:hypothetical protein